MKAPAPAPAPEGARGPAAERRRLVSLDALRGFDMFWIVGGDLLVQALGKLKPTGLLRSLALQLEHKPWDGMTFYDLVFPLFLFIVGVSTVLSLDRVMEREGRTGALRRVLPRALILYLLGLFYYGGVSEGLANVRWVGVLQRIAFCYLAASLLYIWGGTRRLAAACGALLIGYWALMTFVPVPGHGAGLFDPDGNLAAYVDLRWLPGKKLEGDYDPEGLLSTLPAVASCLLGVLAGVLLKDRRVPDARKAAWLAAAGLAGIVLGWAWGFQFPVVKKVWTSSYALLAGGWSALLLAAFYYVVDVRGRRAWAEPLEWIGTNAIAVYMAAGLLDPPELARRVIGGELSAALGAWADLAAALLGLAIVILPFRSLYRRRIFFRV